MHEGEDHREIRVKQPVQRLVGDARRNQRRVGQPVAPEKGDPRDHPDDVRGPERDGAEQEERDLPRLSAHVEGEEIGDGEADPKGEGPDDQRIFDGVAEHPVGHRRAEEEIVVLPAEGRDDREFRRLPEADDDDHRDG